MQGLKRLVALSTLGMVAAGCKTTPARPTPATRADLTPVLLESSAAIRLPPPPADGSPEQVRELEEILRLQQGRTAADEASARFWDAGAAVRWNELARDLVAKYRTDHPMASRAYALVSVAQYDALVATWSTKAVHNRAGPWKAGPPYALLVAAPADPTYPSEHAAVAAASAAVLAYLFPADAMALEGHVAEHEASRLVAGVSFRSDVEAGDKLGRAVARAVIEHARTDGSDRAAAAGDEPLRTGGDFWQSAPNQAPLLPRWGSVTPWLVKNVAEYRAAPPPAGDSAQFRSALDEVKQTSDRRTPEQARIAALWADGAGSYTPAGRWNKIAADLIRKHEVGELRAARAFALLDMSMMDAGIVCWDTKYHYMVPRPSQVDPAISTPVGLPNFPSYPSAHACFSGAGAEVLAFLFPEERSALQAKAEEAALSRVYGGIHYRFDGDAGLAIGRAVSALAIARAKADGLP